VNLNELFKNPKLALSEGSNLASHKDDGTPMPGWQGIPGVHQAQELDLNVHNRSYVVEVISDLLHKINDLFAQQYKEPLWHENSVKAQKFLSGSTVKFFDKKISDEEFVRVKPKVGDIDTQAPDKHGETIKQFLTGLIHKKVGDTTFLGFSPGNSQYTSMWQVTLDDLPVKLQIDFEYGAHDPETGLPTEWQDYSHSSSWEDLSAGIKGVFHKYIDRALPYASSVTTKYVARVLRTSTKISPTTVTDSDYSFAVSGPGGGGVSRKYIPYNDPATGQPMEKDGIPVMQLLEPKNRQYIQNLAQQFEIFFGQKPNKQDQQLKNSFIGTVQLANKYLDDNQRAKLFNRFVDICFEPGSQMITKNDPVKDRDTKMAAIDYMIDNMKLPNAQALRKQAIQTAMAYEQAFTTKKAAAAPAPVNEEAQVKAQFRKGMPHLHDLKPADLLDLLDEIHDGNGNFKLQNIPLNLKIDGFGGRFGKNSEGKPFMGTSRTEPRYEPGFVAYHQKKGTTDTKVLDRAKLFDDLFGEMMSAIKLVDSKLGPGFLVNKQVTCEVLYLPFAKETDEGKLQFVGIHYDKLPAGVKLALVPFHITDATTGDTLPNGNEIVKELTSAGRMGSVMFINNSLTQNKALDVTALVEPVKNIDELKAMLASGKLAKKREAKELLAPVALALEKAIINDPNIIGKDLLGQDYEGIVINSRLGPIKVTSQEQRDIITAKNAAKVDARTERPRENSNKTAVVAVGSFVGHIGHQELFKLTIDKATSIGGDPYLFMGSRVGKDDPVPINDKLKTWKMLYPQYANNISAMTQPGGSLIQKMKHELINPLEGKPPRYDNVIIMTGEEEEEEENAEKRKWPSVLMKAVNKFQGYEHVKSSIEFTPRGTGMSFTQLRNVLKNTNLTPDQQFEIWNKGFNNGASGAEKLPPEWIKHLMDISGANMQTQKSVQKPTPKAQTEKQPVPQPDPTPIAEQRILNALVEGTSIDSTLRAIINDIGEPITSVYDTMKFQAKKYMENHGELGRGYRMVAAGVGGRWVQNMYIGRLHNELYDLCKYNTRRTVDLKDFLRGEEADGEIEMKRSFGNLANNLPPILAKLGEQINAPQLTRNARRWMQNKAEYERYLMDLEAEGDDETDDEPVIKPPKSNVVGQQNAQVDQIVNDILSKIPKHIAGEIRNAIARSPNKLSALKQELNRHHVTMSEDNAMGHMAKDLTGHGSPIAKAAAQRDKKREQHGAQSHGRAEGPKWDIAEEEIKNNHWYDAGVKDATRGARPNPRSIQYKLKANHPDEVYFYMQGYKSVKQGVAEGFTTEKQILTRIRQIMYDRKLSGTESNAGELNRLKQQLKDMRSQQGVTEARMSAAQRLWNAEQKQRAKSNASLARTPSSIPKPEPKKEEKIAEKIKGADGKACWKGKRYAGTKNGKDVCIPVSEDVENIMDALINKIVVNEAISNNRK
jgi:hypothetical protein